MTIECPKCQTSNPDESKFCNECATPLPGIQEAVHTKTLETIPEELATGSTFAGRYQIIEELGKGGMGRVYKVLDKETNEKIALKLIKSDIAADKKTVERFRNELTTARKIVQKNVCRMFDLGREKDSYYITMEYISGQDLRDLIRQTGQLTVGKAVSIAKQICDGLTEAHSLGVVHRDLKPNNIMIDKGGNAKIMDFGIARAVKGKSITGSGVVIGTPQYMSPEQVEGKEVDQQSDIYSLGIILYEMLTTQVPFEGETPLTIGVKQKTEAPRDPRELNERIPGDLSRIILKCLEKDKEDRYQSAEEVNSDLEKLEQGLPTTDHVVPKKKPLTSRELTVQLNVKKLLFPVLAFIALAVIVFAIWSPWSKKKPDLIASDKPTLAILYFENSTGGENMEGWRRSFANWLMDDLSQSRLLHVLSDDRLDTILKKLNLIEAQNYTSEDLENIAELAGVQYILRGSFDKTGETLVISTRLHNMDSSEEVKRRRIEVQGENDFSNAVDQLTPMIKEDLNIGVLAIASDIDENVGTITSEYPEAIRNYYEGYKYHLMMDHERSTPFLKEAIRIDPEFAMAYRCLAVKPSSFITLEQKREYIQKALDYSDKVSEGERLWIQANYYGINFDFEKSNEAFEKLYEFRPSPAALSTIARNYQDMGNWEKAIEYFEKTRNMGDEWRGTFENLGYVYEAKEMYEKAREVYKDYFDNVREDPYMQRLVAGTYTREGQYDLANQWIEKATASNPTIASKAGTYQLMGDFEAAEKEYERWRELGSEMYYWRNKEILYRTQGQYEKAKAMAQEGLMYAEDNNLNDMKRTYSYALAVIDLARGDLDEAFERAEFIRKNAEEFENPGWKMTANRIKIQIYLIRDQIEKAEPLAEEMKAYYDSTPDSRDILNYYSQLGLIEIKKQDYKKAINLFTQAYDLRGGQRDWIESHAFILFKMAKAYELSGDIEGAKEQYKNILALTTGRFFWGDLYVKSYYELGKIHELQGSTAQAIENYEKFLDLWKNADPGLPEIDDAKQRLAGLKQ